MKENMNRKDKIVQAQFNMIQTTGKISGEVKNISPSPVDTENNEISWKEITTDGINEELLFENVDKELTNLVSIIHDLSNALNLDFNKIIGG